VVGSLLIGRSLLDDCGLVRRIGNADRYRLPERAQQTLRDIATGTA
jgi:hypothetical protein